MNGKGGIINPGLAITGILGPIWGNAIDATGIWFFELGDILGGGWDVSILGAVAGELDAPKTGGGTVITVGIPPAKTGGTGGAGIPSGNGIKPGATKLPVIINKRSIHWNK